MDSFLNQLLNLTGDRHVLRGIFTVIALMAGSVLIGTGRVWSAPITFNTALPVAKNEFLVREQFILDKSGDDPGNLDRDRTAKAAVSVLGYGVNGLKYQIDGQSRIPAAPGCS